MTSFFCFCFSIRVFFTDTDDSQHSRGREGTIFYSSLPLPPAHEHWDIYLQLCKICVHMIHRFKEQNVGHSSLLKNEIFQTPILFAEEIFLFFLGDPRSELVRNPVENSISSQSFYYHGNFMKRIRTLRMRFLADLGIILGKTFPFLVLYIMNRGFLLWGNRKPSFSLLHNLEISKN